MATAIRPSAALMEETREEEASSLLSSDSRDLDSHGAVETSRGYAVRNASAVKYSSEELEGASLFAGLSFPEPPSHRPYVAPAGRTASSGPPVVSPPATAPALPTRTVPFDASKVDSNTVLIIFIWDITSFCCCYLRFKASSLLPRQSARCQHLSPPRRKSRRKC